MGDLLQESLAYLKKSNGHGKNLYDHLSDVIVKILEQKPDNAYSLFENVSYCVRSITSTMLNNKQMKLCCKNDNLHNFFCISLPITLLIPILFYESQ